MSIKGEVFFLQFHPESWPASTKLLHFMGAPFPHNGYAVTGLKDCLSHMDKVTVLWRVLATLRSGLKLDREELESIGGTSNEHSKEYAAVAEALLCALYSAVDGLRHSIYGVYKKVRKVQQGSNGELFRRAFDYEYGPEFPEEIRILLADAHGWFSEFRSLRTELTHGATGSCHAQKEGDAIMYFNDGIRKDGKSFYHMDVESLLRGYEKGVRELVESITSYFLARLESVPKFQLCGTYRGRFYARMVTASDAAFIGAGQCMSYDWFEKEEEHICPLASRCEAYLNKWPEGTSKICGDG